MVYFGVFWAKTGWFDLKTHHLNLKINHHLNLKTHQHSNLESQNSASFCHILEPVERYSAAIFRQPPGPERVITHANDKVLIVRVPRWLNMKETSSCIYFSLCYSQNYTILAHRRPSRTAFALSSLLFVPSYVIGLQVQTFGAFLKGFHYLLRIWSNLWNVDLVKLRGGRGSEKKTLG